MTGSSGSSSRWYYAIILLQAYELNLVVIAVLSSLRMFILSTVVVSALFAITVAGRATPPNYLSYPKRRRGCTRDLNKVNLRLVDVRKPSV